MHLSRVLPVLLVVFLALTACGGKEESSETPLPEAQTLLDESANHLQNAKAFRYEIDVDGYPVEIPLAGLDLPDGYEIAFKYARGAFQQPDRLSAEIQFSVGDFSTTAELIAVGTAQYFRGELLTANRWLEEPLITGFTPASLMAQPGGIPYALQTVDNLTLRGKENNDGIESFHLQGTIQAADVYALTLGLIRTQEGILDIDVFVHVDNHQLAQIKLHEPAPEATESDAFTIWTITLVNFDDTITITPPEMDQGS